MAEDAAREPAGKARRENPRADSRRETEADDGRALTTIARAKLSAELVALVTGADVTHAQSQASEIRVRVVLREKGRHARHEIESAGLHLEHLEGEVAIGTIAPARLRRLALLPLVVRVSVAGEIP